MLKQPGTKIMSHKVIQGDWIEVQKTLESESVHCVVTSPPYWGLRDYGVPGQLGLEPTPEAYVRKIVEGFREVRRVLRDDGTLWLNLGDSYANDGKWGGETGGKQFYLGEANRQRVGREKRFTGLKPKDLVGIPWRVAFALQADGWYLRSDIIWAKPNPMPESVTDRPTKAHEYLFLLTKSERYYYDAEAIKEPHLTPERRRATKTGECAGRGQETIRPRGNLEGCENPAERYWGATGRNRRSVWTIATQPFPEAHFATFPEELVKPCILAGTSEKGVCAKCGAPWERITKSETRHESGSGRAGNPPNGKGAGGTQAREDHDIRMGPVTETKTLGWQPTCSCGTEETKRSVVLDPFAGSGTVGLVARLNHCDFIGIELNPEYCQMAERRFGQEVMAF